MGGAEGYKAGLVSSVFGAKSINSDLSSIACKRGVRLFGIPSVSADIRNLPFGHEEFDVVLCSETLEHVADLDSAIDELLRVAKHALVVTVPHDPESVVKVGMEKHDPLGHIHGFNELSFVHLEECGNRVITRKMLNWATMVLGAAIEAMPIDQTYLLGLPHARPLRLTAAGLSYIYNNSVPIIRFLVGKGTAGWIIELDEWLCRFLPTYNAVISVILKDANAWSKVPSRVIRAKRVLDFSVPHKSTDRKRELTHLPGQEAMSI